MTAGKDICGLYMCLCTRTDLIRRAPGKFSSDREMLETRPG